MNRVLSRIEQIYGILTELFPPKFKAEFKEEMKVVFSEIVTAAAKKGKLAFAIACAQEICDLPILIVRTHLEEKAMIKTAHFQPAQFAFRAATSFGLGLSCVKEFAVVFTLLFISALGNRWGWYHVLIASGGCMAAALIGGLLFAFLFGERNQFGWYLVVGALGWFIPFSTALVQSMTNSTIFWGTINILPFLAFALDGAFISMAFCVAKSKKRSFLLPLSITAVLVPILCYIVPQSLEDHFPAYPTIANVMMDVLLIAGAIILAVINGRKHLWVVIAGTLGLPIIYYICIYLAGSLYPLLPTTIANSPLNVVNIIYWIILWLPQGILLGLIISLIFRWQQSAGVEA